jgi:hypothetical protein
VLPREAQALAVAELAERLGAGLETAASVLNIIGIN